MLKRNNSSNLKKPNNNILLHSILFTIYGTMLLKFNSSAKMCQSIVQQTQTEVNLNKLASDENN